MHFKCARCECVCSGQLFSVCYVQLLVVLCAICCQCSVRFYSLSARSVRRLASGKEILDPNVEALDLKIKQCSYII